MYARVSINPIYYKKSRSLFNSVNVNWFIYETKLNIVLTWLCY